MVMVRDLERLGEGAFRVRDSFYVYIILRIWSVIMVMDAWVTLKLAEYRLMESYIV